MTTLYTANNNLYKWQSTDTKQTTITEMASTMDKIDDYLVQIQKNSLLSQQINFSSLFSLAEEDTHTNMQGLCVTDQYIVFAAIVTNSESSNTYLYVIDKNTYAVVNKITNYSFEHANSMAFNKDDNTIAIVHCINAGVSNGKVSIIDASLLTTANPSNLIKQDLTMPYNVQAIAYYNSKYYIFQNDEITVHVTDKSFIETSTFALPNSKIIQGLSIENGFIFIPRVVGNFVSYVIEVYDLSGNLVREWLVPNDILGSEIESFYPLGNGKFISGFNVGQHYFYVSNVYDSSTLYANNWQTITLQNSFAAYSSAHTPQYRIRNVNGQYLLDVRGAILSQATMGPSNIVGNLPIIDYLKALPVNVEFMSLMSSNSGVSQFIRWKIELSTGNLIVDSTTYGQTSVPTGKWCQIQLFGYPLSA